MKTPASIHKVGNNPPYTIKTAAIYLSHSTKSIRNLIKRGVLRSSTVTSKILIPAIDVENLVESTC
ncbi:MAG: helix-turn-helix domain-containing protein [Chthoniobacterales bacterium]